MTPPGLNRVKNFLIEFRPTFVNIKLLFLFQLLGMTMLDLLDYISYVKKSGY